jgi:hypothetical protein
MRRRLCPTAISRPPGHPARRPLPRPPCPARTAPRFAEAPPLSLHWSSSAPAASQGPRAAAHHGSGGDSTRAEGEDKDAGAPTSPQKLVLRNDGVELPADRSVVVQVYVNRPDITAPARGAERGYVGSIGPSSRQPPREPGTCTRRCNATSALRSRRNWAASLATQDNISVTLVPVTGDATKSTEVFRYPARLSRITVVEELFEGVRQGRLRRPPTVAWRRRRPSPAQSGESRRLAHPRSPWQRSTNAPTLSPR